MFLERIFGNLFGIIWLGIFTLAILILFIWLLLKKEKNNEIVNNEEKEYLMETYKEYVIEEKESGEFEVKKEGHILKSFNNFGDCKIFIDVLLLRDEKRENIYEIIEVDGFFKVRKKGSERTIRKFNVLEDAQDYVKEKENND